MALNNVSPQVRKGIQGTFPQKIQEKAERIVSGYTKPTAKNFAETFAYRFVEFFKSIFKQSDFQKLRKETRIELAKENPEFNNYRKSDQRKFVKILYKMFITGNSMEVHKVDPKKTVKVMQAFINKAEKIEANAKKHALKV